MVYKLYYTRAGKDGVLPGLAFGEINLIESFLIWQGQHTVKIDGIEALKESHGKSYIMVETPTGEKLFSFKQLYKYFEDNGLFYI